MFSLGRSLRRCFASPAVLAAAAFAMLMCVPAAAVTQEVPISLEHNRIFIDNIFIKGQGPFRALLDTGSTESAIEKELSDKLGFEVLGLAGTTATGGAVQTTRVKAAEIKAGGTVISPDGQKMLAADIRAQAAPIEENIDMVIGYPLLRRWVVEIDFARGKMLLHEPAEFSPPADAEALDLNLLFNVPIVKIEVEGTSAQAMLDTGSSSAFDSYPEFMARSGLDKRHTVYEMPVFGLGGAVPTILMKIASLKLGKTDFKDIKIYAHSQSLQSGLDGLVGMEILRRYRVIFDYARAKVYLLPDAAAMASPWEDERAGLVALKAGGGYTVVTVVTGSPADAAGLKIGDILMKINGKPASETGISGLRNLVRQPAGTKLPLTVQRIGDSIPLDVTVILDDYVK